MALTLTQQQYLTNDLIKKGVISTFTENSAVLKYLPFLTINANSYVYNRESTLPGTNFRAVGADFSENSGTVANNTETLKILGGVVDIDRYLTLTQNVNDMKAVQIQMLSKSIGLDFDYYFFNGDASSTDLEFDGLDQRLTGDQVIDGGDNTLTLAEVDELIDAVRGGPDAIFCDKEIIRKINDLVRAEGQALEWVDGQFGRKIPMYAGIPLAEVDTDSQGNEILNDNASTPAYELYGVKFGIDKVLGLQAEPVRIVDYGLYSGGQQQRILIEWITSFIVGDTKSAARLHSVQV